MQLTNWLVAMATPIFLAKSSYGAYFLFGGLSLFTVIVLAIYMPETQGRSLESIQETFSRPVQKGWMGGLRRWLAGDRQSGHGVAAPTLVSAIEMS